MSFLNETRNVKFCLLPQETDNLMQTLAKLQLELGLLLDEAQIGQVELQNMVEHLGRQHQRLEKHMFETATTHRRHHSKPSYCPSLAFLLA